MTHGLAIAGRGRSLWRGVDPVLGWAVLVGVAWLALYACLTALGQNSAELSKFVANIVYLVPIVAAVLLSALAGLRTSGRVRVAWRLLFASNLAWLAGETTWTLYRYLTTNGPPVPSVADIGYVLQYVAALPAILIGLGLGRPMRARRLLDALLVGAGVAAIGWQLMIGPLVAGKGTAPALFTLIYPVFDLSIVSVLVVVALSGRWPVQRSMSLVAGAFAVATVSDAGYTYLVVLGTYGDASWLNLGWQIQAVLFCIAALVAVRKAEGDIPRPEAEPDVAILPPLLAVMALAAVAVYERIRYDRLSNVTFALSMVLFVGLLVRQFIAIRDRTRLAQQLQTAAVTDVLTGLYNRRFFDEALDLEASLAVERRSPLSLIMLDIDNFKGVNDRYGHSTGDAVLAQVAEDLRRSVPGTELIARYGGEEFVCLLPGVDEGAARQYAERMRTAIRNTAVTTPDGVHTVRLTASLGVATANRRRAADHIDVDGLIDAADRAVYRAKAAGRDRVVDSGRLPLSGAEIDRELPPALVWLADRIDAIISRSEHAAAMSRWCVTVGARLGMDSVEQRRTAAAARLHDIGKVRIRRAVLEKPGPLDAHEWDEVRRHPAESARIIAELTDRADLAPLVAAHHERYDGRGYPRGLAGTDIPLGARIIGVCDAWASMRVDRTYSRARTDAEARDELRAGRGGQFDPVVVDTFLALLDEGLIDAPAGSDVVRADAAGVGASALP